MDAVLSVGSIAGDFLAMLPFFPEISWDYFLVLFFDPKGVHLMTLLPLADCCQLLDIDPKTLRRWASHASMSLHIHPADARVKCLTAEQVQQLAQVHDRCITLSQPLAHTSVESFSTPLMPQPPPHFQVQTEASQRETDLVSKLSVLETQVSAMQQQLSQLAMTLLLERTQHYEQRLQALERLIGPIQPPAPQAMSEQHQPEQQKHTKPRSPSAEKRARSCVIPLIEYGADGTYVVICPERGELSFAPDSPAWFDWLATLSSFRFVGKLGRLSASRNRGRPCWMAYRRIHGHCYTYGLGNTKRLTIAHLEQMAATLQSHVPAL